ncbi:MAG: Fic family protein [Deltaproteobacteria bacterium]|nr:Fic family protein [Deltaproteobacteria bacterium]
MENRNITFPETITILNGVNVPNVTIDDIQAILNMRDAWKYLIKTIDEEINLKYILKLNEYIAPNESLEWGVLRTGHVGISGTNYRPAIPDIYIIENELKTLLDHNITITEKAIVSFLWIARTQLCWDGNKRTGLVLANKFLIQHGCGILIIKDSNVLDFSRLLTKFYDTNDESAIKKFLYENAIFGIDKA